MQLPSKYSGLCASINQCSGGFSAISTGTKQVIRRLELAQLHLYVHQAYVLIAA